MKLLEKIKRKFTRQTTFCYCPKCQKELIGSRRRTTEWVDKGGTIVYILGCPKCKHKSHWLFDTPVPILVDGVFEEYGDIEEEDKDDKNS